MSKRLSLAFFLLLSFRAIAQTDTAPDYAQTGFPEHGVFQGSAVDSVQLNNGNLHIQIPLVTVPGRGPSYWVKLVFDSKGYTIAQLCTPDAPQACQYKVRTTVPSQTFALNHPFSFNGTAPGHSQTVICGSSSATLFSYYITDPDGGGHLLKPEAVSSTGQCNTPIYTQFYAADGSGWTYKSSGALTSREGVTYTNSSITDANGNQISKVFVNNQNAAQDTLGRVINLPFDTTDASGARTTHIQYPDSNGVTREILITYTGAPVQTNLCQFSPEPTRCTELAGNLTRPAQVLLPNGLKYTFSYPATGFGEPSSMTLPTGGRIDWEYGITDISGRRVTKRTVTIDGVASIWTYDYGTPTQLGYPLGPRYPYALVTDPLSNKSKHLCTYMTTADHMGSPPMACMITETDEMDSQSHMLKQTFTSYTNPTCDGSGGGSSECNVARLPSAETTTWISSGKSLHWEKDYDSFTTLNSQHLTFGAVVAHREYDYTSSTSYPLLRTTQTHYKHQDVASYRDAGLVNLPVSVEIDNAAGIAQAITALSYDDTAAGPTTGVPGHVAASGPRGNLTTESHWRNTDNIYLPTVKTYDDLGHVLTSKDPLLHQTTFSYDDNWANTLCVPAQTNTKAFQTQATDSLGHITKYSYYPCTGLKQSVKDQNDINAGRAGTTFSYDLVNRLVQSDFPDGGRTSFDYHSDLLPLTSTTSRLIALGGPSLTKTFTRDGAGRVKTSTLADPEGDSSVDTSYDLLGRTNVVSNPHRTASASTDGTTVSYYDELGRVAQVRPPDGLLLVQGDPVTSCKTNNTCTDYSQFPTVTVTDQVGNKRRSTTDGLGRLIEVDEPGIPGVTGSNHALMNTDDNFEVIGPDNSIMWSTNTTNSGGSSIEMQDDGNLVLYAFRWSAGVYAITPPASYTPQTCTIGHVLNAGQTLPNNKCITSPDGHYMLYIWPDGNIGIYDIGRNVVTWWPSTGGHPGAYGVMQTDGNFVLYATNGVAVWSSGTAGTNSERLEMENDGRIIIFKSVWNSGTSHGTITQNLSHPACDVGTGTGWTGVLGTGSCFVSYNGVWELDMQTDGNLVLYDRRTTPKSGVWAAYSLLSPMNPGVALVTKYTYDMLGNLTCVEQHGGVSGTGCSSAPSSDAASPWRVRRFTYNSLSQLLSLSNPESNTTLVNGTPTRVNTTYAYDNDGNLTSKTDARGTTTTNQYDQLHRLTYQSFSDGTYRGGFTYDETGTTTFGIPISNGIGRLTTSWQPYGGQSFSYDPMGRAIRVRRAIDSPTRFSKDILYQYDLAGDLIKLTYPSGRIVNYAYNTAGRATTATDGNGTQYTISTTHYPSGAIYQWSAPHIYFATLMNNRLQVSGFYSDNGVTNNYYMSKSYVYNNGAGNNGNILSIVNNKDGNRTQTFTYDALNRITSGASSANTGSLSWGETYAIDAWGNLQIAPMSGKAKGGNFGCAGDASNRANCLSYDAGGNLLNDGRNAYTYEAGGMLKTAGTTSYLYDADGQRLQKWVNGAGSKTYWLGTGDQILSEGDAAGNLNSEYVFFNGKRVARVDIPTPPAAPTVHYYLSDHLGSTSIVVNSTGAIEEESEFYPFGTEEVIVAGPNRLKFTSKERDPETGLDNFGARYFGSSLGRFMRPDDPFADQDPSNPQGWNLYSYVRNNPLSNTDPSGNACVSNDNGGWQDDDRGGESCAEVDENNKWSEPSTTVTASYTDEDRIQMLANDISDLTSTSSLSEVGVNGIMGAQAAEGIWNLPGLARNSWDLIAGWRMASKMAGVRAAGEAGEALANIVKNTERIPSLTGTAAYRVPDILDSSAKVIGEVKNYTTTTVSLTSQLKDDIAFAQANGYTVVLKVREGAQLTQPVQQLVSEGAIKLIRF